MADCWALMPGLDFEASCPKQAPNTFKQQRQEKFQGTQTSHHRHNAGHLSEELQLLG